MGPSAASRWHGGCRARVGARCLVTVPPPPGEGEAGPNGKVPEGSPQRLLPRRAVGTKRTHPVRRRGGNPRARLPHPVSASVGLHLRRRTTDGDNVQEKAL